MRAKRKLPYKTQIRNFRIMYRNANFNLPENFEKDNLLPTKDGKWDRWIQYVDPNAPFAVNEAKLRYVFPHIPLREFRPWAPKGPRRSLVFHDRSTIIGGNLCADASMIVQPHKTADKKPRVLKALGHPYEYGYGRIQITLPKELIGIEAKIHMEFPNAPDIKVRHRRSRKQFDYYQIEGGGRFSKKI